MSFGGAWGFVRARAGNAPAGDETVPRCARSWTACSDSVQSGPGECVISSQHRVGACRAVSGCKGYSPSVTFTLPERLPRQVQEATFDATARSLAAGQRDVPPGRRSSTKCRMAHMISPPSPVVTPEPAGASRVGQYIGAAQVDGTLRGADRTRAGARGPRAELFSGILHELARLGGDVSPTVEDAGDGCDRHAGLRGDVADGDAPPGWAANHVLHDCVSCPQHNHPRKATEKSVSLLTGVGCTGSLRVVSVSELFDFVT